MNGTFDGQLGMNFLSEKQFALAPLAQKRRVIPSLNALMAQVNLLYYTREYHTQ